MKHYLFEGEITNESINPLLQFINDNEGTLHIGLDSVGGHMGAAFFLLSVLNKEKDRVILCAGNGVYSAAFYIFSKFEGMREIAFYSFGMTHQSSQQISFNSAGVPLFGEASCQADNLDSLHEVEIKEAKSILTKSEMNLFRSGKDVFLSFNRMKQIFPDAKIVGI